MSDRKRRCYDLMARIFVLRESCPDESDEELELIDQLDAAWQHLSKGDRDEVNRLSAQIACGLLSPLVFARMLEPIPKEVGIKVVPADQISLRSDSSESPRLEWKTEGETVPLGALTYVLGQT